MINTVDDATFDRMFVAYTNYLSAERQMKKAKADFDRAFADWQGSEFLRRWIGGKE